MFSFWTKIFSRRPEREDQTRYRALVDHSPDAVLVLCDGQTVFVNPAALELLAADRPEDLLGRTPGELVHPDERAQVERRTQEAINGQRATTTERRMRRLDGTEVEVESRVIPFLFEGKRAVQVILRDISARRAAERELRAAEEKYRSIFANAQEGIFQNTPEGVFLSANPALARMLGFASPEELIRERNDLAHQSYADPAQRVEFQRLLEANGVVNNFEYQVRRKDETRIWVSENVRAVRDSTGKTLYYEGSVQDITARKRSEEELRRSVQRFRSFTRATAQIVWQTSPDGLVLEDLPTWREYTGLTTEEILGSGWLASLHPEDRAPTLRCWAESRATKTLYETEYRMRRADGEYRCFAVRGVPVLDADGSIREWVGTSTDITERKRADEILRESEQRFRLLNALNEASRPLTQPAEILATVVRLLGEHLGVSRCTYTEMDADDAHFITPHQYTDGVPEVTGRHPLGNYGPETQPRLLEGRTLVLRDADTELTTAKERAPYVAAETKAIVVCPLLKEGRLLAMISVQQKTPRNWTEGEC